MSDTSVEIGWAVKGVGSFSSMRVSEKGLRYGNIFNGEEVGVWTQIDTEGVETTQCVILCNEPQTDWKMNE